MTASLSSRTASQAPPPREAAGLLSLFTSLPGVSQLLSAVATFNIGPMTELLERAIYLPVAVESPSSRSSQPSGDWFAVAGKARDLEPGAPRGPGGPSRRDEERPVLSFLWRVIPDDYVGSPETPSLPAAVAFRPGLGAPQRIEIRDWRLSLAGGASGLVAYGTGCILPAAGSSRPCIAFVLDVIQGWGELAGLAGTVVGCGSIAADLSLELDAVARMMDPTNRLRHAPAVPPRFGASGSLDGATYLTYLGEVDPEHPVTLRVSLSEGILGSNVFERIQASEVGFDVDPQGRLVGQAARRGYAGTVSARLSFNPLSFCALGPIQTRRGSFEFRDGAGGSLGAIQADMVEGRSLRTWLPDQLLPVFRFGGFGPISGGSGRFAGARGVMTMNSVVSVQPRTLSNLYLLRLDGGSGR